MSTHIKTSEVLVPESRMSELAELLGYDDGDAGLEDAGDDFSERDDNRK